ncbi:hypothetical protein GCM10007977_069750 [Dactylosporangium sucinum]|uniref:Uncharacterized protein n=1 Tax=Dactylosporangium sucinum TaxID=1424081 RepID=A0A917U5B2_9ACTN|nr:hypothetical protein GCM10007977_069750 [Dactylosporangium sucinum]
MATTAPVRRRRTGVGVTRGVAARVRAGVADVVRARGGVRFAAELVARVFEPPRALDAPPPRPAWEVRPAMVTP